MDHKERREKFRLKHVTRVYFNLPTGKTGALIVNQTGGGLFVKSQRLLQPNSPLQISDENGRLLLDGVVRWNKQIIDSTGTRFGGMGVRINQASEQYKSIQESLLHALILQKQNSHVLKTNVVSFAFNTKHVPFQGDLTNTSLIMVLKQASNMQSCNVFINTGDWRYYISIKNNRIKAVNLDLNLFETYVKKQIPTLKTFDFSNVHTLEKCCEALILTAKVDVHVAIKLLNQFIEMEVSRILWRQDGEYELYMGQSQDQMGIDVDLNEILLEALNQCQVKTSELEPSLFNQKWALDRVNDDTIQGKYQKHVKNFEKPKSINELQIKIDDELMANHFACVVMSWLKRA